MNFIRKNETPLEKFQRIQKEIDEIKQEMEFSQKHEKANKEAEGFIGEIEQIQKELKAIADKKEEFSWINKKTQDFSLENHVDLFKSELQSRVTQRVIEKLQSLKQVEYDQEGSNQIHSSSTAKIEFLLSVENENLKKMIKHQELELKVQRLEKVVGIKSNLKVILFLN